MLGSNRPSDSQVEGCVEALSVSRCPRGGLLSSGTVFPLRTCAKANRSGSPDGFRFLRLCRTTIALLSIPTFEAPESWLEKTPGVRGRAPEVRQCTVLVAGEPRI